MVHNLYGFLASRKLFLFSEPTDGIGETRVRTVDWGLHSTFVWGQSPHHFSFAHNLLPPSLIPPSSLDFIGHVCCSTLNIQSSRSCSRSLTSRSSCCLSIQAWLNTTTASMGQRLCREAFRESKRSIPVLLDCSLTMCDVVSLSSSRPISHALLDDRP